MNTPPLLLGAALLFWGWQTGHFALGLLAGTILESSRIIRARWSLTPADFNRLWNVCVVLFLGVGAFLLINEGTLSYNDFFLNAGKRPEAIRQAGRSALVWFQWFPMIMLPFMLAQAFNDTGKVGMATFSWWLRKQEKRRPQVLPRATVNIAFPYVALSLLASGAAAEPQPFFYYGLVILIGWTLWPARPRRQSLAAWSALFIIVVIAGYGMHQGLFHLQKKLEEMNVMWFSRFAGLGFDAREARTAIGSIGRQKLSNRIVLRVRTDGGNPPELLREASYNMYRAPLWTVGLRREFFRSSAEDDNETWPLVPGKKSRRAVTVAQYLRRGEGLLALPPGTSEINQLPVLELHTNLFGAALVSGGPGLVVYSPRYDPGATFDSEPNPDDLRSYRDSEPAVATVARALQLQRGMDPEAALKRVETLFREQFRYATYLSADHVPRSGQSALERFLLQTRSGHCEYFATATTLLLREAGLPTRYAVGYSVQEGRGNKFVVRARHAHSWALVYYKGAWHDFDTTPPSWEAAESHSQPWFQPVKDFLSDIWFQFSRFRWSKTEWRKYFMWAPVPVLVLVVARFFLGKQWKRISRQRDEQRRERARPGIDSDFYLIEKHFAARGLERGRGENWRDWLHRLAQHESAVAQLDRVLLLHHRHRFDPKGLSAEERAELRARVLTWLNETKRRR